MPLPNEFVAQVVLHKVACLANSLAWRLNGNPRIGADSIKDICTSAIRSGNPEHQIRAFGIGANVANKLAKRALDEWVEALAYEIKDLCLSALVRNGRARVNSIGSNNAVGIDLFTPPSRLHTFPCRLQPDAAAEVRRQMQTLARCSQPHAAKSNRHRSKLSSSWRHVA